jgi:hypothetical protein
MISRQNLSLTHKGIYDHYKQKNIYNQIQKLYISNIRHVFHTVWLEQLKIYLYWWYACASEQCLSLMPFPNKLTTSLIIHSMDLQKMLHGHTTYTNTITYQTAQMEYTIYCLYKKMHHTSSHLNT